MALLIATPPSLAGIGEAMGFQAPLKARELLPAWQRQSRKVLDAERTDRTSVPRIRHHRESRALPATLAARRARYGALIEREALRQGVDPDLVHAVIRAESSYRPNARSPAGACGLMQLMPATAQRFGVRDIWKPAENIRGGVSYLRFLFERFDGDLSLVLAAYNAGEGAVAKYDNQIPPYRETQHYIRRVLGYLGKT